MCFLKGEPPNLPTYLWDDYLSQSSNRYQKPEWCGARFPDPARYCNTVHTITRDLFMVCRIQRPSLPSAVSATSAPKNGLRLFRAGVGLVGLAKLNDRKTYHHHSPLASRPTPN